MLRDITSIEQRPSFVQQFANTRLAEDHSLLGASSLKPRLLRGLAVGFRQNLAASDVLEFTRILFRTPGAP